MFHSLFTGYGLAFPAGTEGVGWFLAAARHLDLGVPVFFVISGYCITASADAARRKSNSGRQFFWRRFRRIYPPFWAWFGLTAACVWTVERVGPGFFTRAFVPDPQSLTVWQWFGNLTLTETWRWHWTGGVEDFLIWPAWTLCYEEQFYAVVGLTLILAPRHFFTVLGAVTAVVAAGLLFPAAGINTQGLFLDGRWLMFAAGVLVYYTLNYARPATLPVAVGLLFLGVMSSIVAKVSKDYLSAFVFALLLLALRGCDTRIIKARASRPFLYCGEMCYSLYLIHWPLVTAVTFAFNQAGFRNPLLIASLGVALALAVAITVARVFHVLIERRFLNPGYAMNSEAGAAPLAPDVLTPAGATLEFPEGRAPASARISGSRQ